MLSYTEILYSITSLLHSKFNDIKIYTNSEQISEQECFYISISPSIEKTRSKYTNYRKMYIDIKYFLNEHDKKIKIYEMADKLNKIFNSYIEVKDRRLNVIASNIKFLKDDISDFLNYSIEIEFIDVKDLEFKTNKLMQHIDIKREEIK